MMKTAMKKLLLFLLLITLFLPPLVKADGEIAIDSWTELALIGNDANYPCENASYILTRNLTSDDADYATVAGPGAEFQTICSSGDDFSLSTFDGQNYEIQNLVMVNDSEGVALFGDLEGSTIKNLSLVDVSITGNSYYVAGLSKRTSGGTIENVRLSGTVTNEGAGSECTGGLVGNVEEATTISESSVNASVTGFRYVGGLVGCANYSGENESGATISQSYTEGEVSAMVGYAGGLVGSAYATVISNSYSTVTITESGDRIGGLVGYMNESEVSKSYADNGLISGGNYVGGLIGWAQSTTIRDTYSRSNVSATGQFVGGLVGLLGSEFMGSIYSSYATGNVEGLYTIGGLVGGISNDDIHDSFSTGDITLLDSGAWIGGVFGDYLFDWTIDNVYWYQSDHNSDLACHNGEDCDDNDIAISTTQGLSYFHDASNEPLSGWDFTTIWFENENDYPTLRDMPGEDIDNNDQQATPTPTPIASQRRSGRKIASICNKQKPGAPDLFQINTTLTGAKLFFTPLASTDTYFVSFASNSSAEEHGEQVTLTREGVQSHQIYFLRPNTTYYVKVRGQNGCAAGDWSNIMEVKTDSRIYYKNFSPVALIPAWQQNNLAVNNKPESITDLQPTLETSTEQIQAPVTEENTQDDVQKVKKKCFLWWCW